MKRQTIVMMTFVSILLLGSFNWTSCSSKKAVADASLTAVEAKPTPPAPRQDPPFIAKIKEQIKGKENLPAEEVFENIQIMKGIPAGRVLPIMQMAFSQSLGVKCNHCHEFGQWASDVKPKKQVARDMWVMSGKLNRELLSTIKNLESPQPVVNCTTCHRGDAIPKTSMQ